MKRFEVLVAAVGLFWATSAFAAVDTAGDPQYLEAVAKSLDLPLVVSDDFARAHGGALRSLGLHKLRGLDQTHELFAPAAEENS